MIVLVFAQGKSLIEVNRRLTETDKNPGQKCSGFFVFIIYRGVEQLVARQAHNLKVAGFESRPRYLICANGRAARHRSAKLITPVRTWFCAQI